MGRRRGGRTAREAMHAKRSLPPQINPSPPGPTGGQYKPLDEADLLRIVNAAFEILSDIGMGEAPQVLIDQACGCGATLNERGRLCFGRTMMEGIVDKAAKQFVFYGRRAEHDFELGGNHVYFGTGGAAVQTLDLDTGLYRSSTIRDLHDFARLIDVLPNVSWFTRCCVATDVPDSFDLDVNTAYALLKNTEKPVGTSFTLAAHVDPIIDMFDYTLGGDDKFRKRPFCKAHISPVITPLRYGEDAVDVAIACMRRGVPINNIVAAQSGATSPATLAGMLACTLAESLAALAMVNVFNPGYPMIFSNWPLVIDLRTGSFAGGGGEISLLNAASAQLSNYLGLPSGAACSMSDAKAVDAQMGLEKALSALSVGLAGCNMVYESSGMSASLLGASFEAFVIDNEMLNHVYRILRGIDVNDDTLNLDVIRDAVYGEGHFLGSAQTLNVMQSEYYYPTHSDRQDPRAWAIDGATDIWQRANREARKILSEHQPDYLSAQMDEKLRQKFNLV